MTIDSMVVTLPCAHTHTHQSPACHTSHIPSRYKVAIAALHNATHMTPSHYSLSSTAIHTLDYIHIPLTHTTIHTYFYNDTYTLPPATTTFDLANGIIFSTEHSSNKKTLHVAKPQYNILSSHVTLTYS